MIVDQNSYNDWNQLGIIGNYNVSLYRGWGLSRLSLLTYGYYRYALGGRGVSRPSPQKAWINKLRVCAVHQLRRPSTVMFKIIT